MKHYSAELWPPPTKFNTMNEFAETIEWEQGMIVEWRALVDGTGYTLTAGYQDVVPMDGANNR